MYAYLQLVEFDFVSSNVHNDRTKVEGKTCNGEGGYGDPAEGDHNLFDPHKISKYRTIIQETS